MKNLGDFPFRYTFTRKRVKYLRVRIKDTGIVLITAPMRMPLDFIVDFMRKKSLKIKELSEKAALEKNDTQPTDSVELFGDYYKIEKITDANDVVVDRESRIIRLNTNMESSENRKWFYKKIADVYLPHLVEQIAREMGVTYASVSIRFQKSRWGSCTAEKKIFLNAALIRAPKNIIRYVVVHELAHVIHMNHQKPFWSLVEIYCPDHKSLRRFLKINGNRLLKL